MVDGYPESGVWGTPGRALDGLTESSWKSRGQEGCSLYKHLGTNWEVSTRIEYRVSNLIKRAYTQYLRNVYDRTKFSSALVVPPEEIIFAARKMHVKM